MKPSRNQPGFTLIEVLVVLVIVAIITAVAIMAFGDFGKSRDEKIEVQTFMRMIPIAQSQAILTPALLGLTITNDGYQYYQQILKDKHLEWKPLSDSVLSAPSAFKDLLTVHVATINAYDPDSKANHNAPSIYFLPSGYITPFEVLFKGKANQYVVKVSSNGNISTDI